MLYFRRICLLVALALTFGASELFAQTPTPPTGISVRIVSPGDSAWVGIGGKIVVEVRSAHVLNDIRADSLTEMNFLTNEISLVGLVQDDPANNLGQFDGISNEEGYCLTSADASPDIPANPTSSNRSVVWDADVCKITGRIHRAGSSNLHVARYTFELKAFNLASWLNGISGVFAVARASVTGETGNPREVSNVNRGSDGKFLQIDLGRPVQSATSLTEVGISADDDGTVDVDEDANDTGADDKTKFKIGDTLKLTAKVQSLRGTGGATKVKLGLFAFDDDYNAEYMADPDSAFSIKEFDIDDTGVVDGALPGNILRHSVKVEAGKFKVVGDGPDIDTDKDDILMDDLQVKVAAFFVDRAGNIGASAAYVVTDAEGAPFSENATYRLDSKRPVITIRHPVAKPDSNRFTAIVDRSFTYRPNSGASDPSFNVEFNPLVLKVDESLDSLIAIIVTPKDSLARADILDAYTDLPNFEEIPTNSFRTPNNKILPSSEKGGQLVDLMIVAQDEVGNRATKTVEGVIHDEDPPNHVGTRAFPLADTAPQDADGTPIITNQTRHPVLRFDEVLDSLSIRFIQNIPSSPDRAIQKVAASQLSMVNKDITVTVAKALSREGAEYIFQYYARDLAGNVHILPEQALTFRSRFQNPTANKFIVTATKDSALAGKNIKLTVTAVDSALRRADKNRGNAVTYRSDVRVSAWDGDDLASTVVFAGTGVAKNADGTFNVAGSGWNAAQVEFNVKSNKVIDNFSVVVQDVSTTDVDGESKTTVNFSGRRDSLSVDADRMEKFAVTAWEDGEEAKVVSGEFQVRVIPTDKHGNPSIKKITGDAALDTRLTNANKFTNFNVVLQAANPRAQLPGPQRMVLAGKTFTVIAPNGNGKLTITAIVDGVDPAATAKYLVATGSVTVDYSATAAPPPTPADSLAAPASLTVMDAPDDQGHYVLVTFPLSTDHATVDSYRLYRQFDIGDGNPQRFHRWGDDFEPSRADSLVTETVAVPDAMATHWAIEAIGAKPSGQTVSGKLSAAVVASDRTQTDAPVGAIDNSPPEAVTDVMLENALVSWTLSPSDGPTGETWTHPRRPGSQANAIPGVTEYEIWVGLSADAMYSVGKVDAGESSFALTPQVIASLIAQGAITQAQLAELIAKDLVGVMVRVDALDLSNSVPSEIFTVEKLTRRAFTNAEGDPVYIVALDGDMTVDFADFMAFAAAFDTQDGDEAWNVQADLNDDGTVDFADFILFVGSYGKTAQGPATKPVILPPGVNENAEFSLRLGSERVVVGQNVFVDVSLANVQDLMGYGFVLNYDADKFEFVEAVPADQDLLKSTGGETPLFSSLANEAGQVSIANAVVNASEISGGGDIVRLTFRVLQEFAENARFEIAEGLVFDPQQLSNPAVVAGVLDVQTTPTEFALLQNFPNPFNPETTIGYELAESADVTLQIYNVVGQVVRTLIVAEPQSAGRYQIRWDGMDDRGVSVSSGVYFYRISAGEFQTVRKLMLLK